MRLFLRSWQISIIKTGQSLRAKLGENYLENRLIKKPQNTLRNNLNDMLKKMFDNLKPSPGKMFKPIIIFQLQEFTAIYSAVS